MCVNVTFNFVYRNYLNYREYLLLKYFDNSYLVKKNKNSGLVLNANWSTSGKLGIMDICGNFWGLSVPENKSIWWSLQDIFYL